MGREFCRYIASDPFHLMGVCQGLPSAAGSGRATTFVAAGEALSVILGSALCICSALLCAVACVVRLSIGVRG